MLVIYYQNVRATMYSLCKGLIENYIIQKFSVGGIVMVDGIPKLIFKYYTGDIETRRTRMGMECIEYMLKIFEIDGIIKYDEHNGTHIEALEGKLLIKEVYGDRCEWLWCLNEYKLRVVDNRSIKCRSLLLFLIDPLEFIKRNLVKINSYNDYVVRSFLLDLESKCKNIENMHIKYLLVMEMSLVLDIVRLVIDRIISLFGVK